MLFNFFKIARRNITRNKLLSFINVGGLAVGVATCLLIMQYVQFERSYDQFHENKDNIFRVQWKFFQGGQLTLDLPKAAAGAGPRLLTDFPEVVAQTRMFKVSGTVNISYEEKAFNESKVLFASEDFFKVFSFPLVYGDKNDVLTGPNKVVLSQSAAKKYFPDVDNPVGKMLQVKEGSTVDWSMLVSGVMQDLPANTHIEADIIGSYKTFSDFQRGAENSIFWVNFFTYIQTEPGTTKDGLNEKLASWLPGLEQINRAFGEGDRPQAYVQPLTDIHLHSNLTQEMKPNGDAKVVSILMVAAFVILVIAWLNYINLTTAKGLERAKEVGVKKVIGASKGQLMGQFLVEAFLINVASLLIAFTLYQFCQPLLGSLLPVIPDWKIIFSGTTFWYIGGVIFAGAFLSGYYPALVLSSYKTTVVLKGRATHSSGGHTLRRVMVTLQFGLSLILLASTFTVKDQVAFMLNQDLGINTEQVVVALAPDAYLPNYEQRITLFRNQVLASPTVKEASQSLVIPGDEIFYNYAARAEEGAAGNNNFGQGSIDPYFIPLMGLDMMAGRNFDAALESDKGNVIINESALALLQFDSPQDAVGKQIYWMDSDGPRWTVIGVVEDHHQYGLSKEKEAVIYYMESGPMAYFTFKIAPDNIGETIANLEAAYAEFFPGNPFDYYFLDEHFNQQYQGDQQVFSAFSGFSVVAIIIACLGLFGLASFEAIQRTKEIGIRKVLGASFSGLAMLFSRRFLGLLLISAAFSLPICYLLMDQWLNSYAYRMELSWMEFAVPVGILVTISMVTLLYHTLITVRINPVEALRSE
jgi:putative ABC transport system permease protein